MSMQTLAEIALNRKGKGILVGLAAVLLLAGGCAGPNAAELSVRGGAAVTYRCERGERVVVRYYALSDGSLHFVRLLLPGGREETLPQALSASGARYSSDGEWVWWIKGEAARLERRGPDGDWRIRFGECRAVPEG
jgi:membrane-bound inhibitor of C-type lysozyme